MAEEAQKSEPAFGWLTPEKALDYGYDLHVVNDPYASDMSRKIAQKALDYLLAYNPPHDTSDGWYYSAVLSNVVSLGNGITRRKRSLAAKLESIHNLEQLWLGQLDKSQFWSLLLKVMWRYGGPIAMGFTVFFLTKFLSIIGIVPTMLLNEHGHTETIASILVALVAGGIYGAISNWYNNYRTNRLNTEIRSLRFEAEQEYAEGKKLELDARCYNLNRLRSKYVHEDVCDMPAHSRVIEGDIAMLKAFNQVENKAAKGDVALLLDHATGTVNHWWNGRKKTTNGAPA